MVNIAVYISEIEKNPATSFIDQADIRANINSVCRCSTKAPIRFLLACLYAKIEHPEISVIKPYTEIIGKDTFSGRRYDEHEVQEIITRYKLPCNSTTAFLTPAFRNIDKAITRDFVFVGQPKGIYEKTVSILNNVNDGSITAEKVFKEMIRVLLIIKNENEERMKQLLGNIKTSKDSLPLSSDSIITLLNQHLECKHASRLPVLVFAAAYKSVGEKIGENIKQLQAHNAADSQTGSLGDIEVTLSGGNDSVTIYEMKAKKVVKNDIDIAASKIARNRGKIENYLFVTTDIIEYDVEEYAKSFYDEIGVEIAILDCFGFIKHFLHFFHRYRAKFLDNYQELVLNEPNSAVSQALKEVLLTLRAAAESDAKPLSESKENEPAESSHQEDTETKSEPESK